MSIFGNIFNKIFHPNSAKAQPANAAPSGAAPAQPAPTAPAPSAPASAPAATPAPAATAPVDVGAVLEAMAGMADNNGGNYKSSIVDLLKLLNLDSSLTARKELAQELNVHAGADGSAEQNIALHKAVMQKLAENGGKVPDSMKA